jgi:hypothetical protein
MPARSIGQRRRAARIAENKVGAIGSGGVSDKRRQLTPRSRARASAYHLRAKIFRARRAIGRVATSFSRLLMNIRASVFAAWNADWLCVACWIGNPAIRRGVGVGSVRV